MLFLILVSNPEDDKFAIGTAVLVRHLNSWWPGKVDVSQQGMTRAWRNEKNPALCIYIFGHGYWTWISKEKIREYKGIQDTSN